MPEPKKTRSEIHLLHSPHVPSTISTSADREQHDRRCPSAAETPFGNQDSGIGSGSGAGEEDNRSCADCQTTKTPLWRGGPTGPKSLCNACGIRYRKRRREELLGFGKKKPPLSAAKKEKRIIEEDKEARGLKSKMVGVVGMVGTGHGMVMTQKKRCKRRIGSGSSSSDLAGERKRMGEVEQAAVLLMALASGLCHGF